MEATSEHRIDDVVAGLIDHAGALAPMKAHKLLYYAQAAHLVELGRPLFEDAIEAWRLGPVVASVWRRGLSGYSAVSDWPRGDRGALDGDALSAITRSVRRHGHLSATELSVLTHDEPPWRDARDGLPSSASSSARISPAAIAAYHSRFREPEHAVEQALADALLEGAPEADGVDRDRLLAVSRGERSADAAVSEILASQHRRG